MLLRIWKDLCHLAAALGAVQGRKLYGKVKQESKMEESSYLAITDRFKCFGVSRVLCFSFDYSTEQVINRTNENLVMLLNTQYIQFNVCGL